MTRTTAEKWVYCHYHTGFTISAATPAGNRGMVIQPEVNQILRIKHLRFRGSTLAADRALRVGVFESVTNWYQLNSRCYKIWEGDLSNNERVELPNHDILETWECYRGEEYIITYPHVLSFISDELLKTEAVADIDLDLLTNVLARPNVTVQQSTEDVGREINVRGVWKDY